MVVVATFGAVVAAPIAVDYFFLFDDYRLFGQAATMSPLELLTRPHFGYFRPLVHAVAGLEMAAFGWSEPTAFAAVSMGLHLVAAGLVGRLAIRLGVDAAGATAAAVIFLVSPWTLETLGWASCRFDLWCAVLALLSMDRTLAAWNRGARPTLGWLLLLGALAAKETAATVPLALCITAVAFAAQRPDGALLRYLRGSAVVIVGWLILRALVVGQGGPPDPLAGHRGNVLALLASPSSAANLVGHISSLFWPPMPESTGARTAVLAAGACLGAGLASHLIGRTRAALLLLGAAGIVVLPSLWLDRSAGLTTGGRLAYLPTVWIALVAASGWTALGRRISSRRGAGVAMSIASVWVAGALLSGAHQAAMWRQSSATARAAVEAFEPWLDTRTPVHIANLPFFFAEGPFCLKAYTFERFYGADRVPPLTVTRRILEYRPEGPGLVAGWGSTRAPAGSKVIRLHGVPGGGGAASLPATGAP